MVGLVLVSHSKNLAEATHDLIKQFSNVDIPVRIAAGAGENNSFFGTDATEIADAIRSVYSHKGVLVLMDMGSAVISSKLAIEMVGSECPEVSLCPAPFIEGAVAAASLISAGGTLKEVYSEALVAVSAKSAVL